MKSIIDIYEGLLAGQDSTLSAGDRQVKRPEIAFDVKCKDFKDIVEMFANYFGVKAPKPTRRNTYNGL